VAVCLAVGLRISDLRGRDADMEKDILEGTLRWVALRWVAAIYARYALSMAECVSTFRAYKYLLAPTARTSAL